jgi:uncharacterized protein (TIGR02145 family)
MLSGRDNTISCPFAERKFSDHLLFCCGENLPQGTKLMLNGDDVLHLVVNVGIHTLIGNQQSLNMYPNPMTETTLLEFNSLTAETIEVEIFSMNGALIAKECFVSYYGLNRMEISNLQSGVYTVILRCEDWNSTVKLISVCSSKGSPVIKHLSSEHSLRSEDLKSTKNLVQMQYNYGEKILFKAYSENYRRVSTLLPTQSQTVVFEFAPCTDLDGNHYAIVTIGYQTWMAENLRYLPSVVGSNTSSSTTPFYYVYGYQGVSINAAKATSNYNTYGVLYNWPAVMAGSAGSSSNPSGVQGVCPLGWHLPSDAEWVQLADHLGGAGVAGEELKESGTSHWLSPNYGATNSSGFTALPGGERSNDGGFRGLVYSGVWWCTTAYSTNYAWAHGMYYANGDLISAYVNNNYGFSVRCVKD